MIKEEDFLIVCKSCTEDGLYCFQTREKMEAVNGRRR